MMMSKSFLIMWIAWMITVVAVVAVVSSENLSNFVWCSSPLSPASLESPINDWVDVPDTKIKIDLLDQTTVLISYNVLVYHVTNTLPLTDDVQGSELSFRVIVDGLPYRESVMTVDDHEPLMTAVTGYLILEISHGLHDVKLQWKKRGVDVVKWTVIDNTLDEFPGERRLTVSALHRFIWYTQPLTPIYLMTANEWKPVPGMSLNFHVPETTTMRLFYQLPVRPGLVRYTRDTAAYDEIEAVLEIQGLRYSETRSYGNVERAKNATVLLQGSIRVAIVPGEYSVILYWKSLLGSSRPWYSYPNALDGFATGRVLAVVDERNVSLIFECHVAKTNKNASTVDLRLSTNEGEFSQALTFPYRDLPEVYALKPSFGTSIGGDEIAFIGANFFPDAHANCVFDGNVVTKATYTSASMIVCLSPALVIDNAVDQASVSAAVIIEGTQYKAPQNFSIYVSPTISSVTPAIITRRGDILTVSGSHYQNVTSLSCHFSYGVRRFFTLATFVSPSLLRCRVPVLLDEDAWLRLTVLLSKVTSQQSVVKLSYLLRYVPLPSILSVNPSILLRVGSPAIKVNGCGMMNFHNLRCHFVNTGWTSLTVTSPNSGKCVVPFVLLNESTSHQVLQVESITTQKVVLAVYEQIILEPIVIESVTPTLGLLAGGTDITISTDSTRIKDVHERSAFYCKIGTNFVPAIARNDSALSCQSPAVSKPCTVDVEIWNQNVRMHFASSTASFTYIPAVRMDEVTPLRARAVGLVQVRLGTIGYLPEGIHCLFGSIAVPGTIVADQTIACFSPPYKEAFVTLRLGDSEGNILSENALMVEFHPHASAVSITPLNRIVFSTTNIGIEMEALSSTGSVYCTFQKEDEALPIVTAATTISTTSLGCRIPVGVFQPPVKLLFSVTLDTFIVVNKMELNFIPNLVVKSISPTTGFIGYSTRVRVELESPYVLPLTYRCAFGSIRTILYQITNGSVVECMSPISYSAMEVPISITANDVDFFSSLHSDEQTFHLVRQPFVYSFWPHVGSVKGGTKLLLKGNNFSPHIKHTCIFNNNVTVEAQWQNLTYVSCITPPDTLERGLANVAFSNVNNNFRVNLSQKFQYAQEVRIIALSPATIPMNFNGVVSVFGELFPPSLSWQCRISSSTQPGVWLSTAEVLCPISPNMLDKNRIAALSISLNGQDWSTELLIEVVFPFAITSIQPTLFACGNMENLRVFGTGISNKSRMACFIDRTAVPATFVTANEVMCRLPYIMNTSALNITLSGYDGFVADGTLLAACHRSPVIQRLQPSRGSASGGTLVTVVVQDALDVKLAQQIRCCYSQQACSAAWLVNSSAVQCVTPTVEPGLSTFEIVLGVVRTGLVNSTSVGFYFMPKLRTMSLFPQRTLMNSEAENILVKDTRKSSWTLEPSFGSIRGGNVVRLEAHEFVLDSSNWSCCFNELWCSSVYQVRPGAPWMVTIPAMPESGLAAVSLKSEGSVAVTQEKVWFRFVEPLKLWTISPPFGSSNGGDVVSVHGENFLAASSLQCQFGNISVTPSSLFDNELLCVTPRDASNSPTNHFVTFSLVYTESNENRSERVATNNSTLQFEYLIIPEITSVVGYRHDDNNSSLHLIITGLRFLDSATFVCHLGLDVMLVFACTLERNTMFCLANGNFSSGQALRIAISNDGVVFSPEFLFHVKEEASRFHIAQISLMSGSKPTVFLHGGDFPEEQLVCVFGWDDVQLRTDATIVNDSSTSCDVPLWTWENPREIPVVLQAKSSMFRSNTLLFRYDTDMVVSSVWPANAVVGTALEFPTKEGPFVYTDEINCAVLLTDSNKSATIFHAMRNSPSESECYAPSSTLSGNYQMKLALHEGLSVIANESIELIERPVVTVAAPTQGPTEGGPTILREGRSILSDLLCCFGSSCVPLFAINESPARCLSPPQSPGMVPVPIYSEVTGSISSGIGFEYIQAAQIDTLIPPFIVAGTYQPTSIAVIGANFHYYLEVACQFGDLMSPILPVVARNSTSITCPVPNIPNIKYSSALQLEIVSLSNDLATPIAKVYIELFEPSTIAKIVPEVLAEEKMTFELQGTFAFALERTQCEFKCVHDDEISVYSSAVVFSTDTVAECEFLTIPPPRGMCLVTLSQDGIQITNNSLEIYVPSSKNTSQVTPSSSSVGDILFTIEGSEFLDSIQPFCQFGHMMSVEAVMVSSTTMICSTPILSSLKSTELVDMWTTFGNVENSLIPFTFFAPISTVKLGTADGSVRLRVESFNILPKLQLKCSFDGANTAVNYTVESASASCIAPPMKPGLHTVELVVDGVDQVLKQTEDTARELVLRIEPPRGIQTENIEKRIRVFGENFIDSIALSCLFDDVKAPAVDFISSSQVVCVVPFIRPGRKRVRVSNNGEEFSESVALYEVLPRMSIFSVSPRQGSCLGNTIVTLTGVFGNCTGIECVFGDKSVAAVVVNMSTIECITPPAMADESVLVNVRCDNTFAHVENDVDVQFSYQSDPTVTTIIPSIISQTTKLVNLSVIGSGLSMEGNELSCRFSNKPVSLVNRSLDQKQIWCSFDASSTGVFELTLATANKGLQDILTRQRVQVIPAIQPIQISPVNFDERGGVDAIVLASNVFLGTTSLRCLFGMTIVKALVLSDSEIRCTAPPMRPGRLSFRLSQDNFSWSEQALEIAAFASPILFAASPNRSAAARGRSIVVYGTNFRSFERMHCLFGDMKSPALLVNNSVMECITPHSIPAGATSLGVSFNGIEASGNTVVMNFYDLPRKLNIKSARMLHDGRWSVKIEGVNLALDDAYECQFDEISHSGSLRNVTAHGMECVTDVQRILPKVLTITLYGELLLREEVTQSKMCPKVLYGLLKTVLRPGQSHIVALSGFQFKSSMEMACHIDQVVVPGIIKSDSRMECTLPSRIPGNYMVKVSCAASSELLGGFPIEYAFPPRITLSTPNVVPSGGSHSVDLFGDNLDPDDLLYCIFGASIMRVQAIFISKNHARCFTRHNWHAGSVLLAVIYEDWEGRTQVLYQSSFTFTDSIFTTVTLSPNFGSAAGGFPIQIALSTSWISDKNRNCMFLGKDAMFYGALDGAEILRCHVPRLEPGSYTIMLSPNGRDYQSTDTFFIAHLQNHLPMNMTGRFQLQLLSPRSFLHPTITMPFEHELDTARHSVFLTSGNPSSCTLIDVAGQGLCRNESTFEKYTEETTRHYSKNIIRFIEPAFGWIRGGSVVYVHGSMMASSPTTKCVFGNITVVATFVSRQKLVCISPPFGQSGRFAFTVRSEEETWEMLASTLWFDVFSIPSISTIEPKRGNVHGGTNVIFTGNFSEMLIQAPFKLFCLFGTAITPTRFANHSHMICASPPATDSMEVSMGIFICEDDVLALPYTFQYVPEPKFFSLTPSIVSEHFSGIVAISGASFYDSVAAYCSYNSTPGLRYPLLVASESEVRCALPKKLKPGLTAVTLSFNGQDLLLTGLVLTVKVKPTLLSMTPQVDSVYGGAVVEFVGLNLFSTTSLRCFFGMTWANATLRGDKIICTVPPALVMDKSSRVNVSLSIGTSQYATETFELVYMPVPRVASVQVFPNSNNGTLQHIQVCGSYSDVTFSLFMKLESVDVEVYGEKTGKKLNSSCQVFEAVNDRAVCTSGCDLLLSFNNQTFMYTGKHIKLHPLAQIFSVSPLYGSFRGHEVIRIEGVHLSPLIKLYCAFDDNSPVVAMHISKQYAECESISHPAGMVRLSILTMNEVGDTHVLKMFNFTFIGAIEVTTISPLIGLTQGGTRVHVHGKGFVKHQELRCRFGHVAVPAQYENNSYVTCISPPVFEEASTVQFSVSVGYAPTNTTGITFSYVKTPLIKRIEPSSGMYNKSHLVKLIGIGFSREIVSTCRFGENGEGFPATFLSNNELICALRRNFTANVGNGKKLLISLSLSGNPYFETGFSFTVFEPALLIRSIPNAIVPAQTDQIDLECRGVFASHAWRCVYNNVNVTTEGRFISRELISCQTPPAHLIRLRKLAVKLFHNGVEYSNSLEMDVLRRPEIYSFHPASTSVRMSSASTAYSVDYVIIRGKNFEPFRRIDCRFGSLHSLGTFISVTQVRCQIPVSTAPMRVLLSISFNEIDFITSSDPFEFLSAFEITSIFPSNGAVSGDTAVRVHGNEFALNETITCSFGAYDSTQYAVVISSTEIICKSPQAISISTVDIVLWSLTRQIGGNLLNAFAYTKKSAILMVSPLEAFEKSETVFDVYGRGFLASPLLGCDFRGNGKTTGVRRKTIPAVWVTPVHIKCVSPATSTSVGAIEIGVTNNGVDFVYASRASFVHFRTQIDVASIYPSRGSNEGGTAVFITGKPFDNAKRYWCRFGDVFHPSSAIIISAEELVCISPPFAFMTGDAVLYLSVNGRDFMSTHQSFTYVRKPQVLKISPTRGSMEGSTMISVFGEGLSSNGSLCRFGDVVVHAFVETDSKLKCVAPMNRHPLIVPLEISINDGVDFTQNGVLFSYTKAPRIHLVTPVAGSAAGGTLIQIIGVNFYSSKLTRCCFGDQIVCTHGWLLNDTVIGCLTPPSPANLLGDSGGSKRVPILLGLNGQDFVVLKDQFEYVFDVIVDDVFPMFGDIDGGTMVYLHGRHFRNTTELECRFGNIRSPGTFWNDTTISCEATTHPAGQLELSMSLNGQNYVLATANFTYMKLPSVYEVIPSAGPLSGGYWIHLSGDSFSNTTDVLCEFIQEDKVTGLTLAVHNSPAEVACLVPSSNTPGEVLIILSVNGISAPRLQRLHFTYYIDAFLDKLEPHLCVNVGGCSLALFGDNFRQDDQHECCFDSPQPQSHCVKAVVVSKTRLRCISPPISRVGSVAVSLRSLGVRASNQTLVFDVHNPIGIVRLHPTRGSHRGGTNISVIGWNFLSTPQLACCFNDAQVPATFVNSSLLQCSSPSLNTRNATVWVSVNGQDCLNSGNVQVFVFQAPPSVLHLSPNVGTRLGGTLILLLGENFKVNESSCFFGPTEAPESIVLSATRMRCKTPAQVSLQRLQVRVADNSLDFSSNPVFFTFVDAEEVKSVSPYILSNSLLKEEEPADLVRVPSVEGGKITVAAEYARNSTNLRCFFDDIVASAIYEAPSKIHCITPRLPPGYWNVYISNDGIQKSKSFATVQFVEPPIIAYVAPLVGDISGGELVSVIGFRLDLVSYCRFGKIFTIATVVSLNLLQCVSPSQRNYGDFTFSLWNYGTELPSQIITFVYLSPVEATKRRVSSIKDESLVLPIPILTSASPPDVSSTEGTIIVVRGLNFSNSMELVCRFNTSVARARYYSAEKIGCIAPLLQPNRYTFQVSNDGRVYSNSLINISVYTDAFVEYIYPTNGPQMGGTTVTIHGRHFRKSALLGCKFGDYEAVEIVQYVSSTEIVCISPPQRDMTTVVRVTVTNNNATFTRDPVFFTYNTVAEIMSFTPKFGSVRGGTSLLIRWYNLETSFNKSVACRIGEVISVGKIMTSNTVKCITPPMDKRGKQAVQVSLNGFDFTNLRIKAFKQANINELEMAIPSFYFEYVEDVVIHELMPNLGPSLDANTVVIMRGSGFINTVDLTCIFDTVRIPATFLSPSTISCLVPQGSPGRVTVRVSTNGVDVSDSFAVYLYVQDMTVSRLSPTRGLKAGGTPVFFQGKHFVNHTLLTCRFGEILVSATYLSDSVVTCIAPRQFDDLRKVNGSVSVELTNNHVDFTNSGLTFTYLDTCPSSQFCTHGDIQACPNGTICESRSSNFSLCAPGTFQARQSQVVCLPCPIGFFCPDHGMFKPVVCHAGMVCDENGLRTPVKRCPSGHYCRKGTKTGDIHDLTVAERPYPCPLGVYCRQGIATNQTRINDYSTPQKCYPGFFCPQGSSTPEGEGPCPTGHYCPNDVDVIVCPAGHYCPGVGNLRPRDCYPGTFNPLPKQSSCTRCPIGHVCPQTKMLASILCPAGFVCISAGLAVPVLLCPAGYICEEGTRTLDPHDNSLFRPLPCPKGTYCLGGVSHNKTIDWVPSRPEGATAPQECTEGTYCEEATSTVSGTGVCYVGHYCPPGSSAPIPSQVGSFAGSTGSVVSTMCFPGTYSPSNATVKCRSCPAGHTCPGYGTYIASLCPRGFYRSATDSVTCRACPEGTWSPQTGLTDISQCEICPAGRVCASMGMFSMSSSLPCAAGYVCGEGTNRHVQFDHLCPAGHYCSSATTISEQYANVCEKGNVCVRGTKANEKKKIKCPDGKFCPLGTSNSSSIYINCPAGTWSSSSADELVDCGIRAVQICDKLPGKRYYPKFSYTYQGSSVKFDSTVETSRTGAVEAVNVVYPVNESASVSFWNNNTVDTIRACPSTVDPVGGILLTIIGRNFQNTDRLKCKFELPQISFSQITPAVFESRTRVTCQSPLFIGNTSAASLAGTVQIRVSNYGIYFSTTAAALRFVSAKKAATIKVEETLETCLIRNEDEEGVQSDDEAWFALTGLGKAKMSFDFRHLPDDLVYDEHYKIGIYVRNSTCDDQSCDAHGMVRPSDSDLETSPCHQPVELPRWFLSTAVNKNDLLNLTLLALEDVTFKVEIHVMYGLYASVAPYFVNSTVVQLKTPSRSNVTLGVSADTRPLSRSISFEAEQVPCDYTFLIAYFGSDADYTSPPLNLPPKYEALERGRVLLSHNVSSTASNVPLVVDPYVDVVTGTSYWLMPYGSAQLTHDKVEKYRETFQEMYVESMDAATKRYQFKFDKMLLSYLPFLSNCMEYDSYMPLFDLFESDKCQLPAMTSETGKYGPSWWRRKFPPLPHQDDIRHVGPFDVAQEPTADICMMDIQCHYEENLPSADVTARWFEQSTGTILYYMLREPATLADYLRGGQYYDEILDKHGSDYFIPVKVDSSAAKSLEGDCSSLCFPRSVTLNVGYYQLNAHVKRIILAKLVYDSYDRNSSNSEYTFSVNFYPLDYFQLIIQFAFEKQIFIGLFFILGGAMTAGALIFWILVRITTFLKSPPRFRFWAVFALIAPPPCVGVAMASLPVFSVVFSFYILLSGAKYFPSSGYWLLDNLVPHYLDTKLDPNVVAETRKGRLGGCFLTSGLYLIVLGARIFLPKPVAISEKNMTEQNECEVQERSIWTPTQWKRANMVFTSILLGLFLVLMLEFSFWSSFGNYMFYVIVAQEVVNAIMESWIESRLKEALLMAPLMSALNLIGGIMTFGATDFRDFVLGNVLDFGIMILMRVYVDAATEAITSFVKDVVDFVRKKMKVVRRRVLPFFRSSARFLAASDDVDAEDENDEKDNEEAHEKDKEAETVEPIIDFYAGCSMDRLALFYQPVLILIMMFFREEVMLPILYNIREKDMEIYLWYSLIILLFQLVAEVFVLNVVEIVQDWKLYDYLVYCRYRFLHREQRWKGLEPNLDECIEEGLRTLDQMCFSSQFFMMCTIHTTGIVFFVVGIEMMARARYNLFSDPAMPLLLAFVLGTSVFVRRLVLFFAARFEIWKLKHEDTDWLASPNEDHEFGVPSWDELELVDGGAREEYRMNQYITSDTFRNEFVNHNRSWLANQLPSMLTPRTLHRAKPHLLAQFAKIVDSLNPQIADDAEEDDNFPTLGPLTLSSPSQIIIRAWLARARRNLRLKTIVQPLIQQARKNECARCLSRRHLQVEMSIPIEVLGNTFENHFLAQELDAVAWKDFFAKHQKFQTLCLNCIVHLKSFSPPGDLRVFEGSRGDGIERGGTLNAASHALLRKWYSKAQNRVSGNNGEPLQQLHVSDDKEDAITRRFKWSRQPLVVNAPSTALARRWLIAARRKLQD